MQLIQLCANAQSKEEFVVFYEQFIKLCNENGTRPSTVAEEIGLNKSSATAWKKGATPADVTLSKLSEYFGVPVSYLLGAADENSDRSRTHWSETARSSEYKDEDTLQELKDEEKALLHSYRTMTEEQKRMMSVFIKGLKNDS